ncbi:MAG TPA: papain-like cysteine protease family protein [Candidatus Methylacidiphilales bacterium]
MATTSILEIFHPGVVSFATFYKAYKMDEDGSNEYQIISALRKNGVTVGIRDEWDFEDIVKTINKGFPILGSITHPGQADHWLVIYGYGMGPPRLCTSNHTGNHDTHGRKQLNWDHWLSLWDVESRC